MHQHSPNQPDPNHERRRKEARRERFLEWCKQNGEDPEDEGASDDFNETDSFFEDMDEDNLSGWTDNMTKE
jgi:hypothetical protein